MADIANDFRSRPPAYQEILRLAQETHGMKVTPLQELKGGRTGACLYLVSVTASDAEKVQHLVLKLDHQSKKTDLDELKRHHTAQNQAEAESCFRQALKIFGK